MNETDPMTTGTNKFVGEFTFADTFMDQFGAHEVSPDLVERIHDIGELTLLARGVLTPAESRRFADEVFRQDWVPVGLNGMKGGFDPACDKVGSYRATAYDEALAQILWGRLAPVLPAVREMHDDTPTDWEGHRLWKPVGLNPLLRFIKYDAGGALVPHYDGPYIADDDTRSLTTLVLYLNSPEGLSGGSTRFLHDTQTGLPLADRDYGDWDRLAETRDVRHIVRPEAGSGLLFDHRILHDSEPVSGSGHKLLLRTDVMFERC